MCENVEAAPKESLNQNKVDIVIYTFHYEINALSVTKRIHILDLCEMPPTRYCCRSTEGEEVCVVFADPGRQDLAAVLKSQGWKLLSIGHSQGFGQKANLTPDWLQASEQPIRSQVSSLTKLLT